MCHDFSPLFSPHIDFLADFYVEFYVEFFSDFFGDFFVDVFARGLRIAQVCGNMTEGSVDKVGLFVHSISGFILS